MKRFFSAFLAALMIVMMIVPVNVGAADNASFSITASKDSVNIGEEVTFTVHFSGAEGVSVLSVMPVYDTAVFELVSGNFVTITGDFDGTLGVFMSMSPMNLANADIFQFTLKAKAAASAKTVACSYTLQNINASWVTSDIPFTATDATVSVVCNHTFGAWEKHNAEQHKHTCSACGETAYEAHKWDDGVVTTPATHLTEGEKTYTCTVCDEKKTEKIEKTTEHTYSAWTKHDDKQHKKSCACGDIVYADHNWNAGEITKPASHVATGVKTYTCTDCGETKTETLPKTEDHDFGPWKKHNAEQHKRSCECGEIEYASHNWDAGEITKKPTCKDEGVKTYTCKDCGETKTESIAKTNDHTYGAWTKDTADNHKHTCEICGKTETEAHKWNAGEITKPASHVSTGIKTYTCTECSETKTDTLPKTEGHGFGKWEKHNAEQHKHSCECGEIEYADHNWDAGEITKKPTCKDEGVKTYTCKDCGETKTESIAKTNDHTYGAWTKDTADNHKHTCEICGKTETEAHKWNAGEITKPASHVSTGIKTYTCTECSEIKTETLDKTTDHAYGEWTKHDDKQHKHSCECGDTVYADHNWNAGEITKAPTCKDTGVKTYTCVDCKATKTEVMDKTTDHKYGDWAKENETAHKHICSVCGKTESADHTWNAGEVTKAPTCKDTGVKTYTCTACGATKTETLDKTTEHKWNAGEVTKAPTCKDTGVKTSTCTVCGETKTDIIPTTTNHVFGAWEKCDETVHTHACSVCGKTENRSHEWDKGVITIQPSAGKDGEAVYTCTVCGEQKTIILSATHKCAYGDYKYNDNFHWQECSICLGKQNTQTHAWDNGTVIEPATHTTVGKIEYTCTVCDITKTETLPLIKEHTYSAWTSHDGAIHKHTCECGSVEYEAHNFGEWTVVTAPTTTAVGIEKATCADCGVTVEREIEKLPEAPKPTNAYAVTFKGLYGTENAEYSVTAKIGEAIVFDLEMTREGYSFGGWFTSEDGTEAFDISLGKNDTSDIVLYARWIKNEEAIKIVVEGATLVNEIGAIKAGETVNVPTIVLGEGEKVEWYADAALTIPFDFDNEIDYVASVTLYAKIVKDNASENTETSENESTETTATTTTESTDETASVIVPIIIIVVVAAAAGIVIAVIVIKKKKA